jgi:autotransporter-associated beta strand protein
MILAAGAPGAAAQTFTWTGTGDGNWSDFNNWSGGLVPTSGATTTVQFNATDPVAYNVFGDQIDNPFVLNALNFNTTSSGLITLTQVNPFQFAGTTPGINYSGTGPVLIQNGGGGVVFDATNPFTVGGTGTGTLTIGGDTDNTVLSGAGNVTVNFATIGSAATPNLKLGNVQGWTGNLDIQSGYVQANRTGGDLMGPVTIVSVASGSTFDTNGNAESFGGIEGTGNIVMGTAGIQFLAAGDRTWLGSISGDGGVDQSGGGVFTFGGTNTYKGNTAVGNGTMLLAGANVLPATSVVVLGAGNGGVLDLNNLDQTVGGLTGGQRSGSVLLGSATLTINNTGTRLFNGGIAGTGGIVVSGTGTQIMTGVNTYTGATSVQGGSLVLPGDGLQLSSAVSIAGGASLTASYDADAVFAPPLTGTGTFGKAGQGKLTLATANPGANMSGVSVVDGTLVLDFSSDAGSKLGTNPALTLGSGTLAVIGNDAAATVQNFDSLTLTGGGRIRVTSGNNQNASVAVGAIARSTGTTVDFGTTNTGSGVASISTTTANGSTGIVGGYATVNGTSWAVSGTGSGPFNLTALPDASYAKNSLVAGSHADITSSLVAQSSRSTATLRFNTPGAATLTLAGTNNISTGGLLVTPNVGANDTTITGGNLTAPAGQALLIHQFNEAGNLTIASAISNTANSTTQTVDLAGGATIDGLTNTANLYPGMLVTGTGIPTNARILSVNSPTSITLTANATAGAGVALTFNGGTALAKSGPGTLVLDGTNTYTGALILNDGVVSVTKIGNIGPSGSNVASNSVYFNGGTLRLTGAFNTGSGIQPWIVGPGGGTVDIPDVNNANAKQGNSIFGSGVLNKTGAGTFSVGSNVAPFNGYINVKEGAVRLTSNQLRNSSGMTVSDGAQFYILDTANGPFNLGGNATLTLNGDGPGGTGAYRHGLDEAGSANYAFNSAIYLQTTSRATITTLGRGATGDTITDTFAQGVTGPGSLIKDGDGTLILSNVHNAYGGANGSTIVSNGLLQIAGGDNRLPVNTTLQLGETGSANVGTFDLNGLNQTVSGLTSAGGAGANHQIVNSSFTTTSTLTVNYNGATAQTFDGSFGGFAGNAINLVKAGTGTLTLTASSPYTGTTTVSGGKLRVLGNIVSRPYVIGDGASLDVVNTDPFNTFQMSSLTLGSTSASGLTLELTAATLPTTGVISVNDSDGLVANGKVNVVFSSVEPLTVGQIPLIKYNGTIGGAGFGAFSTGALTLPSRVMGSLVNNTGNSSIDLSITGVDFVKWNGNVNGDWNIDTTQNFKLASNGSATTYLENPAPGDTVVFDETAAGTKTVNLTTTLKPSSVTVQGGVNYTFTGAGKLSGPTGLTKNDGGTLTILTGNDNTGLTTINGGTLQVGNGGTTGSLGSGAINNAGTLVINRSDDVTIASNISGFGTLTKSGGNTVSFTGTYNLTGDTTVTGGAISLNGGGTVGGRILGAGALVKDGPGLLVLAGAATPGAGTTVLGGTLQVGDGGGSGSLSGDVSVGSGATLAFSRGDEVTFAGGISGAGGVSTLNGGKVTLTGPLSYTGKTDVGANSLEIASATDFTVMGAIIGTGTLTKSGAGTITLPGNNPFKGTLEINQGNVILTDGGSGGDINAVAININPGGKFQFGKGGIAGENPDLPNTTYITINGGEYEQRIGEVWGGTRLVSGIYRFGASVGNTSSGGGGPFTGFVMESGTIENDAPTGNATISLGAGVPSILKTTPGTVNVVGHVVFNAAAPINIDDGVLSFDATNVTTGGSTVTLGNGATTGVFRMTGPGSASTNRPFDIPTGAFDVTDPNGRLTLTGALTGFGPLAKTGAGTLALTPSGGYTGTTTVQSGELRFNPGDAGGAFVVNAGATLGVAPGVNNTTSSVPMLTLDDGSNLAFELSTTSNPTSPLLNVTNDGGVVLNGASHLISVSSDQPLQPGQFTLLDYTGTPITSGFSLASLPARAAATLVYNTDNTSIDLNLTGTDSTLWNGDKSADWDLGTAADVGGTKNFRLASNAASTNFITGDRITFDDTASGTTTVNLTTALAPASILVNNDAKEYTFQGAGSIAGGTGLTKQGAGKLTLATDNTYTGQTTVSAGTLQVGAGGTTGSVAGPVFVENGANLIFNRSDAVAYNGVLSGTGNINKVGANTLTIGGSSNGFNGTVTIDGGTLLLDDNGAGGDLAPSLITVNNGGTFVFGETGNPDLPDSTFVTVNTGGVFDLKQGENFGGINLTGGTFRMSGTTRAGVNPTGAATGGYTLESGDIVTSFSGASTGGLLNGNTSLNKVTPGTVTLDGGVTFGTGLTVNIREGVLAMPASSIPAGGTTTVTLGDFGTTGTLRITDAGIATTARIFDVAPGGGVIDTAVAGGTVNLNGDVTDTGTLTKIGPGNLNINGVTTFAGPVEVNGGTLSLAGSIANSPMVTVNDGGTFSAAASQVVKNVTVNAGGVARVATGVQKVLTIGDNTSASPLAINGGKLDVTTNGLVVDVSDGSEGAAIKSVRDLIVAGYNATGAGNNGDFNGNGITSSNAALDHSKAVGYALAGEVSSGPELKFLGQTVDASSVVARFTLAGDATLDGSVDFNDLVKLAQNYNSSVKDTTDSWWTHGDFTYDGVTDFNDLVKLAQNYNTALPTDPIAGAPAAFEADLARAFASVPEPGTLSVLGLGAVALLARRKRR